MTEPSSADHIETSRGHLRRYDEIIAGGWVSVAWIAHGLAESLRGVLGEIEPWREHRSALLKAALKAEAERDAALAKVAAVERLVEELTYFVPFDEGARIREGVLVDDLRAALGPDAAVLLRRVKAEAWDEGWLLGFSNCTGTSDRPRTTNPYREGER
jgi:hypothetical protein